MNTEMLTFPSNFIWGAATAAYQIEGACAADGKGESIWDRFTRKPGAIYEGHTGDIACDHYHRYLEDVSLMAKLALKSYRFSISWPRIFPAGKGRLNEKGLDFYNKLTDALLMKNIDPCVTLYHWDLPQALEDVGGWLNRDVAYYFRDFAGELSLRLGDRVNRWITHNEPAVTAFLGYYTGELAPGIKDLKKALTGAHHLLLSHGLAVPVVRENLQPAGEIGITLNLTPAYPFSDSPEDVAAACRFFDRHFGWFLEPLYRGRYPQELLERYQSLKLLPPLNEDDLKMVTAPTDFLGVNYYTRGLIRYMPGNNLWDFEEIRPADADHTEMDWEIFPTGLYDLLHDLHQTYQPPKMYITENGAAFADKVSADGKVHDSNRIDYLRAHLTQAHRAISDGIPLAGYYLWTLMDNFEWSHGYSKRFGMVYTRYEQQERLFKDSAFWYREVIEQNGIALNQNSDV